MKDKYKLLGPVYDLMSAIYSAKSIQHCKEAMLNTDNIKAEDKILFAGGGHGKDAILAAELGAEVTLVDLSRTMLNKFQQELSHHNHSLVIRMKHFDILKFEEFEQYDMVVANFFLNVFDETSMQQVLGHLIKLTKPGGKLVVGDFALPSGNLLLRLLKKIYWYFPVLLFWLMASNSVHKIYNYPEYMEKMGLTITDKKYYGLLKMDLYWSIIARKNT